MKAGSPDPPDGAGPPLVLAVRPSLVLAVDDQSDFLDALEALLSGEGYDVVTATSAADALARAREFNPTLLITDLTWIPAMASSSSILSQRKACCLASPA
jgi:DNA-binding NtrC family response regulator